MSRRGGRQAVETDDGEDHHGSTSRLSTGFGQSSQMTPIEKNFIASNIKFLQDMLKNLLDKFSKNEEEMDKNTLLAWRDNVLETSKKIISLQVEVDMLDNIGRDSIHEFLRKYELADDEDVSGNTRNDVPDIGEVINTIMTKVEAELRKVDINTHTYIKEMMKIGKLIETKGKKDVDEDADFVVVNETELTENQTLCPYTRQILTEPYKNDNPTAKQRCIHHLSNDAVNAMCRRNDAAVPCPVPGCQGKWMKPHVSLDLDFQRKVQRFLNRIRARSQILGGNTQTVATAIDLDDD